MIRTPRPTFRILLTGLIGIFLVMASEIANGQSSVTLLNGGSASVVETEGLLAPRAFGGGLLFGRSMNAVAHQSTPLLTFGDYQYATWYERNGDENVILGRRNLVDGSDWETFDTGLNLNNGDGSDNDRNAGFSTQTQPWDNHNAINIGISGDGRIHLAYDHHTNPLNYVLSVAGAATGDWSSSAVFGGTPTIQDSFIPGDPLINRLTYPRFATNSVTGDMVVTYRIGTSSDGDLFIANYDSVTGVWSQSRVFIEGTENTSYSDNIASSSLRNPYLNDINYGPFGALHATFTWRETANGTANHDINYITSTDNGQTWLNDSGDLVAGVGSTVTISSPGIIIGSDTNFVSPGTPGGSSVGPIPPLGLVDRQQTLINQQGQAVDLDGGVHVLMWQREDPSTFSSDDFAFDSREAAYFHYYKDASTGVWTRSQIPRVDADGNPLDVGSRPKLVYDVDGNVYAAFLSPGVARAANRNYLDPGCLVIAGATRSSNYSDWEILYHDTTLYEGEPIVDQQRFLLDGVLSVMIQDTNFSNGGVTTSNIRVFDFEIIAPIIPTTQTTIIDDFSSFDPANYTATVILDVGGAGSNNTTFTVNGDGALEVSTTAYDDIEQIAYIRNGLTLAVGEEVQADFTHFGTSNNSRNLGLYVGNAAPIPSATDGDDPRSGSNYISLYGESSSPRVSQRGFNAEGEYANVNATPDGTVSGTYFIQRLDADTYVTGFLDDGAADGSGRTIVSTLTVNGQFGANDGNFVGFYIDVRENGITGTVDNLRIVSPEATCLLGDVDLSGTVDFLDISPFIAVLAAGEFQCEADCNESGMVDFSDIAPFIGILSGP